MKETKWFKELKDKYNMGISNFFLITGNIHDYPVSNYLFMDYLDDSIRRMGFNEVTHVNPASNNANTFNDTSRLCKEATIGGRKKAYIITYPEYYFPSNSEYYSNISIDVISMLNTVTSKEFFKSDNIIIMVTEAKGSISKSFMQGSTRLHVIEVEYPNKEERYEFIKFLKGTSNFNINSEVSLESFASLTAGLTLIGIEDIYLQAENVGKLKKSFISNRKKELIKLEYGDVIEMMDTDGYSFDDYAGQEHLKRYHREVVVEPILNGYTDIVPKGILYTGPPGTGKTHFARCLAGEAGINFVEFKIAKILDKWMGESERNFERALTCFKSIAPVGVFIDELDQAFSRGVGDNNPVNKHIFGMFLSVLSEPKYRGKIIWIGATNYPDRIDEALKRTGRFDKKMPFLPPNYNDRIEVFKIHLNKAKLKNRLNEEDFKKLSALTEGYTQADIEGVVVKSTEVAMRHKRNEIAFEDLLFAVKTIVVLKNEEIEKMTELAIDECNDLEFLPEEYKNKKRNNNIHKVS